MTIGFLSNKLTLRGTEIALFDYAHYSETILNIPVIIITRPFEITKNEKESSQEAYAKFKNRFTIEYYLIPNHIDEIVNKYGLSGLYIIKGGTWDDGLYTSVATCTNYIHCVFGTQHAIPKNLSNYKISVISQCINDRDGTNYQVVPHIVTVADSKENLRTSLNIPDYGIVYGTYSGSDVNIPYAKYTIELTLKKCVNIYFLFMNIEPFIDHPRVFFLQGTTSLILKRQFINTCDAMIYLRNQGETFGLAIGEFSICNKPIICKREAIDTNHLSTLKGAGIYHSNEEQLFDILSHFSEYLKSYKSEENGYKLYTPEYVMNEFKRVFLD